MDYFQYGVAIPFTPAEHQTTVIAEDTQREFHEHYTLEPVPWRDATGPTHITCEGRVPLPRADNKEIP